MEVAPDLPHEALQIQSTEEAAPELQSRLSVLREEIERVEAVLQVVRSEHSIERQDYDALSARVESLKADLQRNQDASKLQRLGSELGKAAHEQICPTCHQDVASELLPAVENVGMGLEENIAFVKSQIELYETSLASVRDRTHDLAVRYQSIERDLRERQHQLRSLRQALVRPNSSPSRVAIEEIVRLQGFLDRVLSTEEMAATQTDELQSIAAEWAALSDQLRRLPADELTFVDKRKLDAFEGGVRARLSTYGFRSFQPSEICISRDDFRPLVMARDKNGDLIEKEINFEISASDGIRLKWAYYLAALDLAKIEETSHAGFLVFDEPGQQEIEAASLYAFLRGAANGVGTHQQVIVSTSEPLAGVKGALSPSVDGGSAPRVHVVQFDGFILQPL